MNTKQEYEAIYNAASKSVDRNSGTYVGWKFWKHQAHACKVLGAAALGKSRTMEIPSLLRVQA